MAFEPGEGAGTDDRQVWFWSEVNVVVGTPSRSPGRPWTPEGMHGATAAPPILAAYEVPQSGACPCKRCPRLRGTPGMGCM